MAASDRSRTLSNVAVAEPARQAGGHWFEPSTAHFWKDLQMSARVRPPRGGLSVFLAPGLALGLALAGLGDSAERWSERRAQGVVFVKPGTEVVVELQHQLDLALRIPVSVGDPEVFD
jgi:hypothetical protein